MMLMLINILSASDQHGYSIGAGRQVAYITVESYARYFVCSDTK